MLQQKPLSSQLPLDAETPVLPWLRRFLSILEPRLAAIEAERATEESTIARIREIAIQRMDATLTPLIANAITRVSSVTRLFQADVVGSYDIEYGPLTIQIAEADRLTFVPLDYAVVRSKANAGVFMQGRVAAYDRDFGLLSMDVDDLSGAGAHSDFTVSLGVNPQADTTRAYIDALRVQLEQSTAHEIDAAEAALSKQVANEIAVLRGSFAASNDPVFTGVPRAPTPGANSNGTEIATAAFVLSVAANLRNYFTNGAGAALDQFNELAAALGNDPNFSTTILAALAKRVRIDVLQNMTGQEQAIARANINAQQAIPYQTLQQGGGFNQTDRRLRMGWGSNDKGLWVTVDDTDGGMLFSTFNSPMATLDQNSYWIQRLATGLILQGGIIDNANQDFRVVFPNAFARCRGVVVNNTWSADVNSFVTAGASAIDRYGFDLRRRAIYGGGVTAFGGACVWMAVGE